jgi:ribosomal protein S30
VHSMRTQRRKAAPFVMCLPARSRHVSSQCTYSTLISGRTSASSCSVTVHYAWPEDTARLSILLHAHSVLPGRIPQVVLHSARHALQELTTTMETQQLHASLVLRAATPKIPAQLRAQLVPRGRMRHRNLHRVRRARQGRMTTTCMPAPRVLSAKRVGIPACQEPSHVMDPAHLVHTSSLVQQSVKTVQRGELTTTTTPGLCVVALLDRSTCASAQVGSQE